MTSANLIIYVRGEVGKVTSGTGELDDADITNYSNWILKRIGDRVTIRQIRFITSVANQRSYAVPDAVLRVQKVYRWDAVDEDLMILGGWKADEGEANEYYNFPSLWVMKMMRKMRGLPRIRCHFDPIERKLFIDPAPDEASKKYYYVSVDKTKWTLDALPEDFEELVVLGTAWKSLEQIALKRSNLGGQMREGGRVTYPSTELKLFVDDKKKEFYQQLDIKSMIYSR